MNADKILLRLVGFFADRLTDNQVTALVVTMTVVAGICYALTH